MNEFQNSKFSQKGGDYDTMKKGFTLIELLIVIAIIAILAAILFVSIGTQPLLRSRDAKRVSDLQNLRTALALFYTDNDRYPTYTEFTSGTTFITKFVPALPESPLHDDPEGNAGDCTSAQYTPSTTGFPNTTSANNDYAYTYQQLSGGQAYLLQACLENAGADVLLSDCDDTTQGCAAAGNLIFDLHS